MTSEFLAGLLFGGFLIIATAGLAILVIRDKWEWINDIFPEDKE